VTICTLRSLWRVATILALPEKSILDLRVNLVKPLLGTLSLLSVCFNLGFEFCNAILSISKLLRKPLRHIHGVSAILLSNIGGFVQKLEDRLTGFVELSVVVVSAALSLAAICPRWRAQASYLFHLFERHERFWQHLAAVND
jgi:hypothetical protein